MSIIVWQFQDSLALPFFGIGMKTDLFLIWPLLIFPRFCWHIECSTLAASYFRILKSSAGIPSPPLALFIIMFLKAHLSWHSRMSNSRWVITPSWLAGSLKHFLYSFSVYYYHLFLIFSASVRSIQFLSFSMPIIAWNVPLIYPIFFQRCLVFPILLFSSISLHYSFNVEIL